MCAHDAHDIIFILLLINIFQNSRNVASEMVPEDPKLLAGNVLWERIAMNPVLEIADNLYNKPKE